VNRKWVLLSIVLLALGLTSASASNLLVNDSFQSGDFTGWTLGTTANGDPGSGFPIVTTWPLGGSNAAKYEVGEVAFTGLFEGATLSQNFSTPGGSTILSFLWSAQGDGIHTNSDGGMFELLLDGVVLAQYDVGQIAADLTISSTLSDTLVVSPGTHTFEIQILRRFATVPGNTPYQYVTAADVEGAAPAVPEPSNLVLFGSGVVGVAGLIRRKLHI